MVPSSATWIPYRRETTGGCLIRLSTISATPCIRDIVSPSYAILPRAIGRLHSIKARPNKNFAIPPSYPLSSIPLPSAVESALYMPLDHTIPASSSRLAFEALHLLLSILSLSAFKAALYTTMITRYPPLLASSFRAPTTENFQHANEITVIGLPPPRCSAKVTLPC